MSNDSWRVFDIEAVKARRKGAAAEYHEFLNVPSLNCGLYFLRAGSTDMQSPHDDDEVYLVLEGRARLRIGDEERAVGPGNILYIGATMEHSFFEIEEDMTLLVMFAASPPDRSPTP